MSKHLLYILQTQAEDTFPTALCWAEPPEECEFGGYISMRMGVGLLHVVVSVVYMRCHLNLMSVAGASKYIFKGRCIKL